MGGDGWGRKGHERRGLWEEGGVGDGRERGSGVRWVGKRNEKARQKMKLR